MGHTQGGWEEQEQEQPCHGQHANARMSNTRTDSDVARETGEQKGPREAVAQGAHDRPGLVSSGGGRVKRDNEPGTDPSGPHKNTSAALPDTCA